MINSHINGVHVQSDKRGSISINGSRISFADGSWCDVNTSEIYNVGKGYIELNGSRTGATSSRPVDTATLKPVAYDATRLEVGDISADVTVEIHDRKALVLEATGPSDEVNAIRATVRNGALVVTGTKRSGSGGISVINGGVSIGGISFGSIFSSSSVSMGGGSAKSDTQIKVKVPVGTSVSVSGIDGQVTVGDTHAPLAVRLVDTGDVHAGRIGDLTVRLSGTGDVTADYVTGNVEIKSSGTGDIEIINGNVGHLSLVNSGTGDVSVDATTQTAELTNSGTGDVRMFRVVREPRKRNTGTGKIRVRQVG